jgi:hypothetical protein
MDLNALKEKLQQLNRRTNNSNDIWKPKDEHEVRLIPYPHGPEPFNEIHFHYEVGESPAIVCPKLNFGEDCAVCDFADRLKSWKDKNGRDKPEVLRKSDFETFKKIQAKARVYVPMVERGKESEGPKFWGVTPNQSLEILQVCADSDRLSELGLDANDTKRALDVIFRTDLAYDLKVSFRKPGEKGNTKSFTQIVITGGIKAKPLSKDKAQAQELLAAVKNIKDLFPPVSSDDVAKALNRWVSGGRSEESVVAESKPAEQKYKTNSSEDAGKKGGKTIDEAFGDMLPD